MSHLYIVMIMDVRDPPVSGQDVWRDKKYKWSIELRIITLFRNENCQINHKIIHCNFVLMVWMKVKVNKKATNQYLYFGDFIINYTCFFLIFMNRSPWCIHRRRPKASRPGGSTANQGEMSWRVWYTRKHTLRKLSVYVYVCMSPGDNAKSSIFTVAVSGQVSLMSKQVA